MSKGNKHTAEEKLKILMEHEEGLEVYQALLTNMKFQNIFFDNGDIDMKSMVSMD